MRVLWAVLPVLVFVATLRSACCSWLGGGCAGGGFRRSGISAYGFTP